MVKHQPTPYNDVNEILIRLLAETRAVLNKNFGGMYLYGSLSSGDFELAASDIDFLIVTDRMLTEKIIRELAAMHERLWDTGIRWADKLEGSYIPKAHLRRYEKSDIAYPTVNEGRFYMAPHGSDWIIQRHIIYEHGITLAGPDPKTLVDPVGPEEIRSAVEGVLQEWWFPMLDDPSWLKDHGSEYHAYAILTMCRSIYALRYGKVISKTEAARQVGAELGGKWPQVIEKALIVRIGQGNFDLYRGALELIRYTMKWTNLTLKKR